MVDLVEAVRPVLADGRHVGEQAVDSIVSITASAAAQDDRVATEGGTMVARREAGGGLPDVSNAPIGRPPPSPLAKVMMSGATPWAVEANHAPVRPMPVWTSSTIEQ